MTKAQETQLRERFFWRRFIALTALASFLIILGFVLIVGSFNSGFADNIVKLSMIIVGGLSVLGGVVATYMGVSAYEHGKVKITK